MVKIEVINKGRQPLPAYATAQSAGMDLRANIPESFTLQPQVRPRSGLALKHGITVLNSPGTIDSDYRGELMVLLINLSQNPFTVNDGERIAQLVIARHEQAVLTAVEVLDKTERGTGGYGHTGVK